MKLALLAVGSLIVARESFAKCAMQELAPALVTPKNAAIPADGGVLVGFQYSRDDEVQPAKGDPSMTAAWTWSQTMTKENLAPGLTVYKPKSAAAITVKDGKKLLGTFTRDPKAAAAGSAVPRIGKLEITTHPARRGRHREATVTSTDPIPNDAFGAIVYVERGGKSVPIAFGTIDHHDPKSRTFIAYADPSRCAFAPPGTEPPPVKGKVTIAWFDRFGRVSKQSAPVEVTEVPPPAGLSDDD